MSDRWYAAQTHPAAELTAEAHLKRQGFENYLPAIDAPRAPLLWPGYIFVSFDIDRDRWRSINGTRGIVKLLPISMEIPRPLPEDFVDGLKGKIAAGVFDREAAAAYVASFVPDEELLVTSGPFEGHHGRFGRRSKGAVVLLLTLLGSERGVPIPAHQVARPRGR